MFTLDTATLLDSYHSPFRMRWDFTAFPWAVIYFQESPQDCPPSLRGNLNTLQAQRSQVIS